MNPLKTTLSSLPSARRRVGALVLVAGLGFSACGSDTASVTTDVPSASAAGDDASDPAASIADPWSREPAEGQTTSAVYGVVTNNSGEDITAIAATTSVTDTAELHEVTMNDDGQMSMNEKEGGFLIPAGESFTFEPGGPHIMLLGIDPATYPDMVDVTLSFDNGTTLDFTAEVRAIGGDEMDMDDTMDDTKMDGTSMDDTTMDGSTMDDMGS